jgi:hypothetical protein
MRKRLIVAFLVALANIPLAYAQEGPAHKINPFEFPVTISKCQPSAVDNKHDPNPAVRVDIAVDNNGFTVAHHMANGVTYIRGEQYAVRAFQIDKNDPNIAIWIGLRRNDPDVVMVGYLQYVPDGTSDKWHYWEVVANRAKPWTIDHPELVSSCWDSREADWIERQNGWTGVSTFNAQLSRHSLLWRFVSRRLDELRLAKPNERRHVRGNTRA